MKDDPRVVARKVTETTYDYYIVAPGRHDRYIGRWPGHHDEDGLELAPLEAKLIRGLLETAYELGVGAGLWEAVGGQEVRP